MDKELLAIIISSIITLLISIISLIVSIYTTKKQHKSDKEMLLLQNRLEDDKTTKQREYIHKEIITKYRDPLLQASIELYSKLVRINQGRIMPNKELTILYTIGQFLCWRELIRNDILYLDMGNIEADIRLRACFAKVHKSFSSSGITDTLFQLDYLEQRAIGEIMKKYDENRKITSCIGYAEFCKKYNENDDEFNRWFDRLNSSISIISSKKQYRATGIIISTRLCEIISALGQLISELDVSKITKKIDQLEQLKQRRKTKKQEDILSTRTLVIGTELRQQYDDFAGQHILDKHLSKCNILDANLRKNILDENDNPYDAVVYEERNNNELSEEERKRKYGTLICMNDESVPSPYEMYDDETSDDELNDNEFSDDELNDIKLSDIRPDYNLITTETDDVIINMDYIEVRSVINDILDKIEY